jgi:hypothetical protein
MDTSSFFIQRPEDAARHLKVLTQALKKVALAGLVGGAGCAFMALLLGRFLTLSNPNSSATHANPGVPELSGIAFVAWFLATALVVFSILYFIAGWGLGHQKPWARYAAGAVFTLKILLCIWLGRASLAAMILFLLVAGFDFYGIWVLLSKQTEQLFRAPEASALETSKANGKPANLVT